MGLLTDTLYLFHGTLKAYDRVLLPGDPGFQSEVGQTSGSAFYTFGTTDPDRVGIARDNARVYAQDGMVLTGVARPGDVRLIDAEAPIGEGLYRGFKTRLQQASTGDATLDAYYHHLADTITPETTGKELWGKIQGTLEIKAWQQQQSVASLGEVRPTLRRDRGTLNRALQALGMEEGIADLDDIKPAQRTVIAAELNQLHADNPTYSAYYKEVAAKVLSGDISRGTQLYAALDNPARIEALAARMGTGVRLPTPDAMDAQWVRMINDLDIAGISYEMDGVRTALFQGEEGIRQLPEMRVDELHGRAPTDLRTRPGAIGVGDLMLPRGGGRIPTGTGAIPFLASRDPVLYAPDVELPHPLRLEYRYRPGETPVRMPNGTLLDPLEASVRGYGAMVETSYVPNEAYYAAIGEPMPQIERPGLLASGEPAPEPTRGSWLRDLLKPTAPDAIVGRGGSAGLGIVMLANQFRFGENDRAMGGVQAATSWGSLAAATGAIVGDAAAVVTTGAERLASVAPRLTLTPGTARVLGMAEGAGTKLAAPLAAAAGLLETGTALKAQDGHRAATAIGATAGGLMAGMAAGAATGAIVGTFIPIPIVGTAAGFVVGAGVGLAGAWLGGKIADKAMGTQMQGMVDDMARDEMDVERRLAFHERNQGPHTSTALAELEDMAKKAQDQLRRDYTRVIPLSDARALRNRDESIARATNILERVNEETGRHFEAPERPRTLPTIDDRVKVDPKKALAEKVAAAVPANGNLQTDNADLKAIARLKERLQDQYHGENNVLEGQIRDASERYVRGGGTLQFAKDTAAGKVPTLNRRFTGMLGGWNVDSELRDDLKDLESKGWAKLMGNHDDKLKLGELKNFFKEKGISIAEVDKNHDGHITGREITDALRAHGVGVAKPAKPATGR